MKSKIICDKTLYIMKSLYNRNKAQLLSLGRLFHFYLQTPKSFVIHKADFVNYLPTMVNNSSTVIIFTVNKKPNACKNPFNLYGSVIN